MSTESAVVKRLKEDIGNAFKEVRMALRVREKLLLRQVDVIASCQTHLADEIKFIPNEEIDIMESIRCFGKFNLPHLNFANDMYVSEDYICPDADHETMYKCLNTKDEVDASVVDPHDSNEEQKSVERDAFDKRILKENMSTVNESIINLTLREAKELIRKVVKPCDGTEAVTNETKSVPEKLERVVKPEKRVCLDTNERVTQASQTELIPAAKYKKPNFTINNCNGTINLKNISNLTINCSGQTSIQTAQKANIATALPGYSSANSDVISSTVQSDVEEDCAGQDGEECSRGKDSENNSVDCEFYNRLIKEIKNTIKNHQRSQTDTKDALGNHVCSPPSAETNGNDSYNRKLLLKNFENLKVVLENNENDTHPVQIEQWLTEIITETEIEPMQNTGILEHSKFSGKNVC